MGHGVDKTYLNLQILGYLTWSGLVLVCAGARHTCPQGKTALWSPVLCGQFLSKIIMDFGFLGILNGGGQLSCQNQEWHF